MKTQTAIENHGWSVEIDTTYRPHWSAQPEPTYRAYQGSFYTMWRKTLDQVYRDVESIVKARKEQQGVPF